MTETVMSLTIDKLAPAILAAKKEMTNAVKDAKNPFFKSKFADLNAVREAAEPPLAKHGISVLQPMVQKEGKSFVRTMLLHESGQFMASDTEVVCAKQNDPQAYGSAVSYARRYGLQAFVSLGADDDDGEAGMGRAKPQQSTAIPASKSTSAAAEAALIASPPKEQSASSFRKPKAPAKAEAVDQSDSSTEGWS